MDTRAAVPLFRIVQVEVAGEFDLSPGRWTVRGHANRPRAVVIVAATERPRRRFRRSRRRKQDAATIPATRLTVVEADPLDVPDPERWLAGADGPAVLDDAISVLQRLLHLSAIAANDPHPRPLRLRDLTRATLAYGTGHEGSEGRWTAGRRLSVPADRPERVRRSGRGLGSEERLAELLGGRDAVLAAEPLTLRARQDLDAGRVREAALQLRIATEVAIAELEPWRAAPRLDDALRELRDARGAVAEIAAAAVRGGLEDEQIETVRSVLATLTRALERRAGGRRVGEQTAVVRRSR